MSDKPRHHIFYILSDNLEKPREPKNSYLREEGSFAQTYYNNQISGYEVVYVRSATEILQDAIKRCKADDGMMGNVNIGTHGKVTYIWGKDSRGHRVKTGERYEVWLPVTPGAGEIWVDPNKVSRFRDNIGTYSQRAIENGHPQDAVDLDEVARIFDNDSTVAIFGCNVGRAQNLLDAMRDLFGGEPTVVAPKLFQGFNLPPFTVTDRKGRIDAQKLRTTVRMLEDNGLVQQGESPEDEDQFLDIFRGILGQVKWRPGETLLKHGRIPFTYLTPNKSVRTAIYPPDQDVMLHWGVSQPRTESPERLAERWHQLFPGWGPRVKAQERPEPPSWDVVGQLRPPKSYDDVKNRLIKPLLLSTKLGNRRPKWERPEPPSWDVVGQLLPPKSYDDVKNRLAKPLVLSTTFGDRRPKLEPVKPPIRLLLSTTFGDRRPKWERPELPSWNVVGQLRPPKSYDDAKNRLIKPLVLTTKLGDRRPKWERPELPSWNVVGQLRPLQSYDDLKNRLAKPLVLSTTFGDRRPKWERPEPPSWNVVGQLRPPKSYDDVKNRLAKPLVLTTTFRG